MKNFSVTAFFGLAIFLISCGAWLTHVITTILREEWLLLIAGAVLAPVGVVHGVGIWLGVW
jgi:hypothetical protein